MCLGGALSKEDCSLHLAAGIFIVHNSRYAARPIIRDIILPRRESNRDNGIRFPDSAIDGYPMRQSGIPAAPRRCRRHRHRRQRCIFIGHLLKANFPMGKRSGVFSSSGNTSFERESYEKLLLFIAPFFHY